MIATSAPAQLALSAVPFLWAAPVLRDFYSRIADEAPVDVVYVGETICAKRHRLVADIYPAVIDRLERAGKSVVLSTLAEAAVDPGRRILERVCRDQDRLVEANDPAALFHLRGRPHHIGPFLNVYYEQTVAALGLCRRSIRSMRWRRYRSSDGCPWPYPAGAITPGPMEGRGTAAGLPAGRIPTGWHC